MSLQELFILLKGGAGSGNWGHAGRLEKRGGSAPRAGIGAAMSILTGPTAKQRQQESAEAGKILDEQKVKIERMKEWTKKRLRVSKIDKERGLSVASFVDPDEKKIDMIAEWASSHNEKVLKGISTIVIANDSKVFADEFRRIGGNASEAYKVSAFWSDRTRTMVIRNSGSKASRATFDHEIGHAAWKQSENRGDWMVNYRLDKKFDRHTSYSRTSPEEGFAESYMAYIARDGKANMSKMKDTFSFVEEIIDGIPA